MGNADTQYDISLNYFLRLREEIFLKMDISVKAGYYKLIAIGITLSFLLKPDSEINPTNKCILLVLAVFLSTMFDLFVMKKDDEIVCAGRFIKDNIENFWLEKFEVPESILWETYSFKDDQRLMYSWFHLAQFFLTLTLIIGGIYFSCVNLPQHFKITCLFLSFFLVINFVIITKQIWSFLKKMFSKNKN